MFQRFLGNILGGAGSGNAVRAPQPPRPEVMATFADELLSHPEHCRSEQFGILLRNRLAHTDLIRVYGSKFDFADLVSPLHQDTIVRLHQFYWSYISDNQNCQPYATKFATVIAGQPEQLNIYCAPDRLIAAMDMVSIHPTRRMAYSDVIDGLDPTYGAIILRESFLGYALLYAGAIKRFRDFVSSNKRYKALTAVELRIDPGVIYGTGRINSYLIKGDGTVSFSKASAIGCAESAERQGFEVI
jgi:hypothetical protein